MSFLNDLPEQDKELIISLPYRVGVWISHSDDVGGEEADENEKTALNNILAGFTQDVFGSEVVQFVMAETVSHKESWESWSKRTNKDEISKDCSHAIEILKRYVDEKEVSAFKQRLYEIAEAVALAFREYEELDFSSRMRIYIIYLKEKWKAMQKRQSFKSFDGKRKMKYKK